MLREERIDKPPVTPGPSNDKDQDPHDLRRDRSPIARAGWLVLGLAFVCIGAVGVVIPGLPTTPFLVLAASCFVRSSERLYRKLLSNPIFGPPIRDFREGRGLPRRIKYMAIGSMWCFVALAVLWAIPSRLWIPKGVVLLAAVIGTLYLRSLPNTEDSLPPAP